MKNVGSLDIKKGAVEGTPFVSFDAVPYCNSNCGVAENCPYTKFETRCGLRKRYIECISRSLLEIIPIKNEVTLHRIGFFMIPLYTHLISLKIELIGMNHQTMLIGKVVRVNPLFKEIRDTIRLLDQMLENISVDRNKVQRSILDGDSDFYDNMLSGEVPLTTNRGTKQRGA